MFEAAIQREHKKALKLGIMQGLREGELRGKQAIGSLLKQGAISQEQAKQALKGFL